MPRPTTPKRPPNRALLGLVLLLCALIVVACGKSSPSSSTSASVAQESSTTGATGGGSATAPGGGSTTGTTGTGSTGGTTSSTGSSGSTQPGHRAHGHGKRETKATSRAGTKRGRVKGSNLRRCLEQNGVKSHSSGSKGTTPAQLQAALKRCNPQLARRTGLGPSSAVRRKVLARPGYRQALARFTSCMRAHGVPNFPEANTSGNGPLYPAGAVKPTPQVRAAQRACISQLKVRH